MSQQLITQFHLLKVLNPVSAGTTNIDSDDIDTWALKADRLLFLLTMGAIAADALVTAIVKQSDDAGDQDPYVLVPGAFKQVANNHDNKIIWIEVSNFTKRYVRGSIERAEGVGTAAIQNCLVLAAGSGTQPCDNTPTRADLSIGTGLISPPAGAFTGI